MTSHNIEWSDHPKILEINTWPWLKHLSTTFEDDITLLNIPEGILDLDFSHFDAIWLMGVWERSPKSREIATNHIDLQKDYNFALKDLTDEDIIGSPYAIYYYQVNNKLGGRTAIEMFREELAMRGIKLILDFVPNHVAVDHLWTSESGNIFIEGSEKDLEEKPDDYYETKGKIIAHGKDPYFYPWTDTAQINAFSDDARDKAKKVLERIADICDGVRCDMAMLVSNEIFKKTWGEKAGPVPENEYWEEIIPYIREKNDDFKFIAEVYWDMEWSLMEQGFDFCYDKTLYDRLKNEDAGSIKGHLNAEWDYQRRLLRFIENHDEKRAIEVFGEERSKAAAIIAMTLPGARMIHEGQMKGYKIKIPVQLKRRKEEEENLDLLEFYLRLINAAPRRELASGKWKLCQCTPVEPGNFSYNNLISYMWQSGQKLKIVVVNYSPYSALGQIMCDIDYGVSNWTFTDVLAQKVYTYKGEDLRNNGLYIDLDAWKGHIFDVSKTKHID